MRKACVVSEAAGNTVQRTGLMCNAVICFAKVRECNKGAPKLPDMIALTGDEQPAPGRGRTHYY